MFNIHSLAFNFVKFSLISSPRAFPELEDAVKYIEKQINDFDPAKWIKDKDYFKMIEACGEMFSNKIGCSNIAHSLVAEHDKIRQYKEQWEEAGVPLIYGAFIYMLSKEKGWADTVRNTSDGFVPPGGWVIDLYKNNEQIKKCLEETFYWLKPGLITA